MNQNTAQMLNMRENFRADIRRKDQESFFSRKRLGYKQLEQLPNIQKDQILPRIKECLTNKNFASLKLLHLLVFKLICEDSQNEQFFLQNFYLDLCEQSLQLGQFDCLKSLTNLCLNQNYGNTPTTQSLFNFGLTLLKQPAQLQEDIFLFLANTIFQQQINLLILLPQLLQICLNADNSLSRGIIYLLAAIIEQQNLDENQKLIGIQIVIDAIQKNACEENLMPLGKLYDQRYDELILKSPIIETLMTHECTMIDKCLGILKLFTLSDSSVVANKLLDFKILDKLQMNLSNKSNLIRKEIYLILSNLSYNDAATTQRIVEHPILVNIVNNIITSNERRYCMSVILNLQATGSEAVYMKLIDLGIVQIVCSLLDIAEVDLLKQLLDSILRMLTSLDTKERYKQQNLKNKLELIFQNSKDQSILEACLKLKAQLE